MNKVSIKYILQNATLSMGVAFMFVGAVLCMDGADVTLLPETGENVLSLLIRRGADCHHTLCSLAINKNSEKLLRDTAPERRQVLTAQLKNMPEYTADYNINFSVWHKYGSAWGSRVCCNADHCFKKIKDCKKTVVLRVMYFGHQGLESTASGFTQIIPGFEKPKFNERGNVSCYGLYDPNKGNKNKHLVEFFLYKPFTCWLFLSNEPLCRNFIKLVPFQSFPHLLKVFLDGLQADPDKSMRIKFCDLNKVIIPDNYQECIPSDEYRSYNELPKWWREVIDNRYGKQQKNKNERKHQ
jgi:hypothetical protein